MRLRSFLALLSATLLAGCAASGEALTRAATDTGLAAAYAAAIADAAVFEPDEVAALPAITDDSMTVVSWIPERYRGSYPVGQTVDFAWDVWVTQVPQLQERCRTVPYDSSEVYRTVQQYLGLPVTTGARFVATFRVATDDLFRACADPSMTSTSCGETFPDGVSEAHKAWIATQSLTAYQRPGGFPWTRLGYTYDWGSATSEVGAFEYVVKPSGRIRVVAADTPEAYCSG